LAAVSFEFGSFIISLHKNGTEVFNNSAGLSAGSTAGVSDREIRGYVLMNGSTDYLELYVTSSVAGGYWPRVQWHGHMVRAA
jgi:hypothetical protein